MNRRRVSFGLRTMVVGVALVASGVGLWWPWEPWITKSKSIPQMAYSKLSHTFHFTHSCSNASPDGERIFKAGGDGDLAQITTKSGSRLFTFSAPYSGGFRDCDTIVARLAGHNGEDPSEEFYRRRRRRPEFWYGITWLWEFWATAAFTLALPQVCGKIIVGWV